MRKFRVLISFTKWKEKFMIVGDVFKRDQDCDTQKNIKYYNLKIGTVIIVMKYKVLQPINR